MKKILLIAQEGLNKGGVQTVIMSIVKSLCHEYQFDIVLFTKEKRYYDDEFSKYGGKIFRISYLPKKKSWQKRINKILRATIGYFQLKQIIRNHGPYEAIHCHNSIESVTALLAAKRSGIEKRVNQIHIVFNDSEQPKFIRWKNQRTKKKMSELATASIGCSEKACKSFFLNEYSVVVNPYDDTLYNSNLYSSSKSFNRPVLIQVGNFSDLKNQLFSLSVFECIHHKFPSALFFLVGHDDDGYLIKMKQYIDIHELNESALIFPSDADIPRLLSESSYLLLPSRTESFGIVLVEAQSMGLKCFVSDRVPTEPNVGGCIFLSINDNPEVWANKIIEDFAKTNGSHSFYDTERFKSKTVSSQIAKLYK